MEINLFPETVKTKSGIKRDKRLVRTKKAILIALMQLMTEKDLSQITVTELTVRANINRKTFYLHYDRIEDIITDFGHDLMVYSRKVLRSDISPDGKINIDAVFASVNRTIEENLDFFRLFVRSGAYHIFIGSKERAEYINGMRAAVSVCFRPTDMAGPYFMEFVVSGLSSMYIKWLSDDLPAISLSELSACAAHCVKNAFEKYGDKI